MLRKSRLRSILLDMLSRHVETGEPIADGFLEGGVMFKTTLKNVDQHPLVMLHLNLIELMASRQNSKGVWVPDAWVSVEVDADLPE